MSEEDAGPRKFGQRPGRPAPRAPGPQPESPSESGSNQNDAVQPAPATVTSTNATTEGVSSSSNAPFSSPPLRSASGTDISSAPDNNSNHRRVVSASTAPGRPAPPIPNKDPAYRSGPPPATRSVPKQAPPKPPKGTPSSTDGADSYQAESGKIEAENSPSHSSSSSSLASSGSSEETSPSTQAPNPALSESAEIQAGNAKAGRRLPTKPLSRTMPATNPPQAATNTTEQTSTSSTQAPPMSLRSSPSADSLPRRPAPPSAPPERAASPPAQQVGTQQTTSQPQPKPKTPGMDGAKMPPTTNGKQSLSIGAMSRPQPLPMEEQPQMQISNSAPAPVTRPTPASGAPPKQTQPPAPVSGKNPAPAKKFPPSGPKQGFGPSSTAPGPRPGPPSGPQKQSAPPPNGVAPPVPSGNPPPSSPQRAPSSAPPDSQPPPMPAVSFATLNSLMSPQQASEDADAAQSTSLSPHSTQTQANSSGAPSSQPPDLPAPARPTPPSGLLSPRNSNPSLDGISPRSPRGNSFVLPPGSFKKPPPPLPDLPPPSAPTDAERFSLETSSIAHLSQEPISPRSPGKSPVASALEEFYANKPAPRKLATNKRNRESAYIVAKLGINSPQSQTTDMMKQRGKLVEEIVGTEATYRDDLRLIVSKFLVPLRANLKVISPTDVAKLFLNIESLELISEEINATMQDTKRSAPSSAEVLLAPIYLNFTETMLQGFSLYCAGHSESLALLTRLKKKAPNFLACLEQIETDEALNKLRLADYLTRPVQHICRQPLLLRELVKTTPPNHPDYEELVFALDKINDLVERINSNAKEVMNLQSIVNVESSVCDMPDGLKLLMPGRYLLREGRFLKIPRKGGKLMTELYIFLFNDMLILTKPKLSDGEYQFTEMLSLYGVLIEDMEDSADYKNAFSVTSLSSLRSHVLVSKDEKKNNELVKRDWLQAITTTKTKFEKGLAGQADDQLGIAFKIQGSGGQDSVNPYEAMRDQLASVAVQQRIIGWKGEDVLKEIIAQKEKDAPPGSVSLHSSNSFSSLLSSSSNSYNVTTAQTMKFHMEAPAIVKIISNEGQSQQVEEEAQVFVFAEFAVIASEKKDVQVKKPYEWVDHVVYSSSLLANVEGAFVDKKIAGGRTVFSLALVSASSRKKYVLYFRSEIVKSNLYQILSKKMPVFDDASATINDKKDKRPKKDKAADADSEKSSTLRTKKSLFGKKLGYRSASQSISEGSDPAEKRDSRQHSQSVSIPHSSSTSSSDAVDDDEGDKPLTAEGFEIPPWFPDDSSHVCLGCGSKFTATNRRHHCRNCGQLFCSKCTTKKCYLPRYGFTQKKMRVCEKCFIKH